MTPKIPSEEIKKLKQELEDLKKWMKSPHGNCVVGLAGALKRIEDQIKKMEDEIARVKRNHFLTVMGTGDPQIHRSPLKSKL